MWKKELFDRIGRIREVCGELCNVETLKDFNEKVKNINGYPTFTADINCDKLMTSEDIDAADLTFPTDIPEELVPHFTLNGLIPIRKFRTFFKDRYLSDKTYQNVWTKEDIDEQIKQTKEVTVEGEYTSFMTSLVQENLGDFDLNGKSILVIGSEDPWVEVACLALGAAKITTLEYGNIVSLHPQIETFTPDTFRKKYASKTLEHFDGVVSISSLEHSGLGKCSHVMQKML